MRVRRTVAVGALASAVVVAAVVTLAGSSDPRAPEGTPTATPLESEAAAPAVLGDCWIRVPGGNVSMTGEEARALTTRAAALRWRGRPAALAVTVQRLLDQSPRVAGVVASALTGRARGARLNCSYARTAVDPERRMDNGLTPRANRLRRAWTEVFGQLPAGGFAAGGVSTGHVDGSAHYEGRAVDVFFVPSDDARQRRRGWVFAQWLVAHAQEYHVLSVIYADHIWTSWAASAGWREYVHPSGNRSNPVLRHLDHVHVAVESGRPWPG